MGVGLVRAALTDAAEEITGRKASKAMVSRPTVQVNLGRASSLSQPLPQQWKPHVEDRRANRGESF